MITLQQIRGARAMLDLKQSEHAALCGLSTTGLNNIERGTSDPKVSTLSAIQHALETAGVHFTPHGVELAEEQRRSQAELDKSAHA